MSKMMILALLAVIVLCPVILGLLVSPVIMALRDTFSNRPRKRKATTSGAIRSSLTFEKEGSGARRRT